MSQDVSSPASMRHTASGNPGERYIPVESSLLVALLVLIPVLVLGTALGFLLNWWLVWTIPALLTLVVWLLLWVRTREAVSQGIHSYVDESRLAEHDDAVSPARSQAAAAAAPLTKQAGQTELASPEEPAGPHERAQQKLNEQKSVMARAVEIIHAKTEEKEAAMAGRGADFLLTAPGFTSAQADEESVSQDPVSRPLSSDSASDVSAEESAAKNRPVTKPAIQSITSAKANTPRRGQGKAAAAKGAKPTARGAQVQKKPGQVTISKRATKQGSKARLTAKAKPVTRQDKSDGEPKRMASGE